jgi:1,4-dihydroxy-2-naphthoate octaprenyltransferase
MTIRESESASIEAIGVVPMPEGDGRARKSRFFTALRPFSLTVAFATCGLGVLLAVGAEAFDGAVAAAVLAAGLLLQIGVNLINDHADLGRLTHSPQEEREIRRNARLGWIAIVLACGLGLWLVSIRGWPLLLLGVTGVLGLWGYAAAPINLKSRGLGLPAVFLLTGVLMVCGSYFAVTGALSLAVIAWSVAPGLFAALLLLANEMRDFEEDVRDGHRTFSVRFGYGRAAVLYRSLAAAIAAVTVALAFATGVPAAAVAAAALPLLPLRALDVPAEQRRGLARRTGRVYALYSSLLLCALWMFPA